MGYEVFRTGDEWYWRLRDGNSKVIADGAEGYDSASNAKRAIANVTLEAQSDVVVELPEDTETTPELNLDDEAQEDDQPSDATEAPLTASPTPPGSQTPEPS